MAPEGVSTCRSRSAKGEWVEKVYDYVTACSSLKGIISDMRVKEDFESRQHKAVTFVVQRGKGRQEWNEEKKPRALPGYRGRLPGRSTEDKGREEGEEGEESEQRQEKHEKIEEGIGSSQRVADERQNPIQRWDRSQIENEEEEETLARRRPHGRTMGRGATFG